MPLSKPCRHNLLASGINALHTQLGGQQDVTTCYNGQSVSAGLKERRFRRF